MNNRFVAFALVALLALTQVYAHQCGTHLPPRGNGGSTRATAASCLSKNPCDIASVRDSFIKTDSSPMLAIRVNSIYFGPLSTNDAAKAAYDKNNAFFVAKYKELLGINVVIDTKEVTTEYQTVGAEDKATHLEMAQKYYREGWMTAMYSHFDPNPKDLLGYASQFPNELPTNMSNWYTIMGIESLAPNGTTIPHEVGHMLGLYHTFIDECDACAEGVETEDRNIVGDFCNDTLAVQNEPHCNGTLNKPNDCLNVPFGDYSALPLDNYMAYTDDSCQTKGFTPQQSGRARCYLNTTLTFLIPDSIDVPIAGPTSTDTPTTSNQPTSIPTTSVPVRAPVGKVSSANTQAISVTFSFVGLVIALTFAV